MENRLCGGDYVDNGSGGIVRLFGSEALLAQALFCLSCRRGSFPFLPSLGSELWRLRQQKGCDMTATAAAYAAQALEPLGLRVVRANVCAAGEQEVRVQLELTNGTQSDALEVTI